MLQGRTAGTRSQGMATTERKRRIAGRYAERCTILLPLLVVLGGMIAVGCDTGDQPGTAAPCAYSLTLSPGQLALTLGQQGTVTASVNTCSASRRVEWAVADTSVASFTLPNDTTAVFTGKKAGGTSVLASLRAQPTVIFPLLIQVQ